MVILFFLSTVYSIPKLVNQCVPNESSIFAPYLYIMCYHPTVKMEWSSILGFQCYVIVNQESSNGVGGGQPRSKSKLA